MEQAHPTSPAEIYEQYFVPAMFLPWARILLHHADLQPGERVLDVACGTGIVARRAAPFLGAGGHIDALDISPAMLAVARNIPAPKGVQIVWHDGDAAALPFPDNTFDAVLCQHGLPFFPDRASALRDMHRVLTQGGRAVAMALQGLEKHRVFQALMQSVALHLSQTLSAVMIPFALYDANELRALFTAAGFSQVEIISETAHVRFPQPDRFIPLVVASSAAAIPAFAQAAAPARATLLDAVTKEVGPVLQEYRQGDVIAFSMFSHLVIARK